MATTSRRKKTARGAGGLSNQSPPRYFFLLLRGVKSSNDPRVVPYLCGRKQRMDQTYTVFGEVFRGMEVVDKIVAVPRDEFDNLLQAIT